MRAKCIPEVSGWLSVTRLALKYVLQIWEGNRKRSPCDDRVSYSELQRSNKFSSIWLGLPKFSVSQVQEAVN
jgi:hypothetical protein